MIRLYSHPQGKIITFGSSRMKMFLHLRIKNLVHFSEFYVDIESVPEPYKCSVVRLKYCMTTHKILFSLVVIQNFILQDLD